MADQTDNTDVNQGGQAAPEAPPRPQPQPQTQPGPGGPPRPYEGGSRPPGQGYGGGGGPRFGGGSGGGQGGYRSGPRQGGPGGRSGPGGRGGPGARGGPGGRSRDRYVPRRKVCGFCVDKVQYIDYKDVPRLRKYLSDRAKIEPRRKTGTCARHQRALSTALKRARHMALLPYVGPHSR